MGPICTIMQNFTPIGATVAEISVTGQTATSVTSGRDGLTTAVQGSHRQSSAATLLLTAALIA